MIGKTIIIVEVWLNVGENTLVFSACFEKSGPNESGIGWWDDFHQGLNRAIAERWQPNYNWVGCEANAQAYQVTEANVAAVRKALAVPPNSAARWQCLVDLPPILEMGNRFTHLEEGTNGIGKRK